jgi:hypothetical protein
MKLIASSSKYIRLQDLRKTADHYKYFCPHCGYKGTSVEAPTACEECKGSINPNDEMNVDKIEGCKCGGEYEMSRYCGAWVCMSCDDHRGLERCYCGWSKTSPGQGRQELEDMGETIEPDASSKAVKKQAQHNPTPPEVRCWLKDSPSVAVFVEADEISSLPEFQELLNSVMTPQEKVAKAKELALKVADDKWSEIRNKAEQEGIVIYPTYGFEMDLDIDRINWEALVTPMVEEAATKQTIKTANSTGLRAVRLHYADGSSSVSDINASVSDADVKTYFEGQTFDIGTWDKENLKKCVRVEFLKPEEYPTFALKQEQESDQATKG